MLVKNDKFKIDAIKDLYRNKLWALFQDRCFRCGSTHMLELDHHIPQSLGGRLVAGNLVLLCSQCNLYRKDKHPEEFYTPQQLSQLKKIFQAQLKLFNFKFDWSRWNHNPEEYLLSLGIPEIDIQQVLTSEDQYNDNYWINVESKRRKVTAHIRLKYRKTNDNITERTFDIEAFSRGQEGYHVHGFCHKKKKHITLSSLGFIDPIDIETGEAISDIKSYLEEKYATTTNHKEDLLFDKYGWAIYSLVYLSATSGSTQKNERDIIMTFIKSLDGFSELNDQWIDATIKNIYRPGKMEIRKWIKMAFVNGENVQLIIPAIEKLASLHKNDNLEFKSFVKYLTNLPKARTVAATDQALGALPEADIDNAIAGLLELINVDDEKARFDNVSNESYKADALRILKSQAPEWYDHSKGHTFWGYAYADYVRTFVTISKSLDADQQTICDYFASLAITDGTISAGTIAEMAKVKGLMAEQRGEIKKSIAFLELARLANPKTAVKKKLTELEKKRELKK